MWSYFEMHVSNSSYYFSKRYIAVNTSLATTASSGQSNVYISPFIFLYHSFHFPTPHSNSVTLSLSKNLFQYLPFPCRTFLLPMWCKSLMTSLQSSVIYIHISQRWWHGEWNYSTNRGRQKERLERHQQIKKFHHRGRRNHTWKENHLSGYCKK